MTHRLTLALALALACHAALAGQKPPAPTPAARAVATLEARLGALLKEGTGFAFRRRYEAMLAEASAVAERHAGHPGAARAHLVVARCCEVLGKHPEKDAAFAHYISLLVAHSKTEAAKELHRAVEDLVARRELYAAIKILRLMLSKFPEGDEAAYALYRLGTCHLWLDRYEEAAGALAELLQRWPASTVAVEARLRLARANLLQGKPAESVGLLAAHLAQNPKSPRRIELLFDLAVAHYMSADYYGALAGFRQIAREAPKSAYAPLAQAWLAKLRAEVLKRVGD